MTRTAAGAERILAFWLDEIGPAGWYAGTAAIDAACRDGFLADWTRARDGGLRDWLADARGTLAFLILTDQLPRNMFRGRAEAFSTDPLALGAAKQAVARGFDRAFAPPERQFFYLPFEHSEDAADQAGAVALIGDRLPDEDSLLHARAHRAVIARFGRFPNRNAALGRADTADEAAWLRAGGYGAAVRALREGRGPF